MGALAWGGRIAIGAMLGVLTSVPGWAQAIDDETRTVVKMFEAAYGDICFDIGDRGLQESFPLESWPLSWTTEWSDTPETATLYKLFCFAGAYNANHIYYLASGDEWLGIQPVSFAKPEFEVTRENDDIDGAVLDIVVTGMAADVTMVNSEFDPRTGLLTDHSLWRGLGDASAVGTWRFHEGRFILQSYDVDPSYDGEIDYERIVDFTAVSGGP